MSTVRLRGGAVALAVAAVAAAAPAVGSTVRSGLYGLVMRGPTQPVCRAEQPCEAPAPGVTLVFSRAGRPPVRATTGQDGSYRVALGPGIYSVRTSATPFGAVPRPSSVKVRPGRFDRIVFRIDTGIR